MGNAIAAANFLDWMYLCEIATPIEDPQNFREAVFLFAYNFTSAANEEIRNTMLREWLADATYGHSRETNEDVIQAVAYGLRCPLEPLRQFAKENGIRLKRETAEASEAFE